MDKWDMLKAQFLSEGGRLQKLDIHEFSPGNRGLMATEDIKEDDYLMFIPEHYLLKRDLAKHSETYQSLMDKKLKPKIKGTPSMLYLLE